MSGKMQFTPQQQCAIEDRGGALLVSAAAGSGKTRVLVERLLRRLQNEPDCSVTDFLIITYTRAAAAELRGRITDGLAALSAAQPDNRKLRRETALAARAEIGTIHSFCTTLLRKYAHLTDLSPDFTVLDETAGEILRRRVLEDLLERRYEQLDKDPSFAALVDAMAAGRSDARLVEIVLETYGKIQSHPDPEAWVRRQKENFMGDGTDVSHLACGRFLMERAGQAVEFYTRQLRELCMEAETYPDFFIKYGESLTVSLAGAERFLQSLSGSWDQAREAAENLLWPGCKPCKGYDDLKERRKTIQAHLRKQCAIFAHGSREHMEDMWAVKPAVEGLFDLTLAFDRCYSAEKRRRGAVDFSDLEHMALRLLTDRETGAPTDCAIETSHLYKEIMVDEYQDVNRVQDAIFRAVSRSESNLFMVGDVKQSIYRFRLADPAIFLEQYHRSVPAEEAEWGQPRKVMLSQNFRSRAGVLEAANFVFQNVMSARFGEIDYTEEEYLYPGAAYPPEREPAMELTVLDRKECAEEGEAVDRTDAEAEYAARRIVQLMRTFRVTEGTGSRPLRYSDVAVLLRSVNQVRHRYEEIFARYGIPVSGDGAGSFLNSEEISVMLSLLTVIDNPYQDVELAAVLLSPLFGFTADELADIRRAGPGKPFWEALRLQAESDDHCRVFLTWLNQRRSEAQDITAEALIRRVYDTTGALGLFSALPGGDTRRNNLLTLLENASAFSDGGNRSLFGFVSYLRGLLELGREPAVPASGGGDAVSLMSIHKSKGLEFPVVILTGLSGWVNMKDTTRPLLIHADLGAGPRRTDTARKIVYTTLPRMAVAAAVREETLAEELRVLYVAMTRAREKLICLVSFANAEKELGKLLDLVDRLPVSPGALMDTRRMADWLLLPALCRPEAAVLRYGRPAPVSIAPQDEPWQILLEDFDPLDIEDEAEEEENVISSRVDHDFAAVLQYRYPHAGAENIPSKVTATELKGRFADGEAREDADSLQHKKRIFRRADFAPEKPLSGAEKGVAHHLVMQFVDFAACGDRESIQREIRRLEEQKLLTPRQAAAVRAEKIEAFFHTETGRALLAAQDLHREMKFSVLLPSETLYPEHTEDQIMLQGVVDCCFETDEGLTVLDFKTDYVTEDTVSQVAESYKPQLQAYAYALHRMMKKPVTRRVLYFFSLDKEVEV